MTEPDLPPPQRFANPAGPVLAYRYLPGAQANTGPLIVFLPGYMSDMAGGKAGATMAWAAAQGRSCLLLDYSGCGESDGDFADGSLSRWRDEVLALIAHVGAGRADHPVLIVGSSMGGWLMLLVAESLARQAGPEAVHGLIGIAPAPDFIRWRYSEAKAAALDNGQVWLEENIYGPEPTPYHPAFHADAKAHLLLERGIDLSCPVHLLHGQRDPDVPWQISLQLAEALASDEVRVTLVKDGDHRLSRESDVAMLVATVAELATRGKGA